MEGQARPRSGFHPGPPRRAPVAIECKWTSQSFHPAGLQAFRRQYGEGENYIVCPNLKLSFTRTCGGLAVPSVNLETLAGRLKL